MNMIKTNEKIGSLRKELESSSKEIKRYKEEPSGNFRTENDNN